jgi:hypothetical protein
VLACSCDVRLYKNPLGKVISSFLYAFSTQSLKTQQYSIMCPNILWYRQKLDSSDLSAFFERLLVGKDRSFFTAPLNIWETWSFLKEYNLLLCLKDYVRGRFTPLVGLRPLL